MPDVQQGLETALLAMRLRVPQKRGRNLLGAMMPSQWNVKGVARGWDLWRH